MSNRPFGTPETVRDHEATGIQRPKAEPIAQPIGHNGEQLATRSDFRRLEARVLTKKDLERFKADLYRALWIHGASIVAIVTALEFLP